MKITKAIAAGCDSSFSPLNPVGSLSKPFLLMHKNNQ
jgi:hypothetical protein